MGMIEGRQTGRRLQTSSFVRARIVSLAPNSTDPRQSKIGLTCKQPGLGGIEWLMEERED